MQNHQHTSRPAPAVPVAIDVVVRDGMTDRGRDRGSETVTETEKAKEADGDTG